MKKSKYRLIGLLFLIIVFTIVGYNKFYDNSLIELTDEEKSWLKENKGEIKIAYTPNYPPVEFTSSNGEYIGMSADYFNLLEKKLGIKFKMVEIENWNEVLEKAKKKEISGITAATRTKDRNEFLAFTKPYIHNPNVIITKGSYDHKLTLDEIQKNNIKIVVVKGYAIIEYLEKNYPMINYETVLTVKEGLRKVSFGKVDAMVIEIMAASSSIDNDNISNLVVNNETAFESNLSIAVRKDWKILRNILNKALDKISAQEHNQIKKRWIQINSVSIFKNRYFWVVLLSIMAFFGVIIIVVVFWNKTLKNAVDEKTNELLLITKKLKNSEQKFKALSEYSTDIIMRFDKEHRHLYVNPATKKITNLDIEEFIGKTHAELGFPNEKVSLWDDAIDRVFETSKPYNIEFKINDLWLNWSLMPEFSENSNGEKYVSAVITSARDITDRKISEEKMRYQSYHDELTGVFNRTYFNEVIHSEILEENLPVTIVLGDVNGLKITNDTLGHKAGDELLVKIAEILKKVCRFEDIVARIGGDEFIILLLEADESTASRICSSIKKQCLEAEKAPIKPSIALGYATIENINENIEKAFKVAEDYMYQNKIYESESTNNNILESLKTMLRETTNETLEHSQRLEEFAILLGKELNLSDPEINALSSLADLHDLGKVAISEKILQKEGPLTDYEWKRIKRHPELGYKIASASPKLTQIAEGILCHHERWDGNGYPQGLKGENIPLLARIITIVDSYDVMTNNRPYKKAMTKKEAIDELRSCSGTQFDPNLTDIFITKVLNK